MHFIEKDKWGFYPDGYNEIIHFEDPEYDYDFYNDNYSPNELAQILTKSNYILVPSRRVFKNYSFPYHQNLFNGELGFSIKKVFQPFPDFLLNSENAEETWTVFDRPTLRLYQKNKPFSADDYEKIL